MPDAPPICFMYEQMQQACIEALSHPIDDWCFKADARYRSILEKVTPFQAGEVLTALSDSYPHLIKELLARLPSIATENDSVGNPLQNDFPSVPVTCSPQNMQYLWHAVLLLDYLQKLGALSPTIIEIGGGYGGMALYTHRLSDLFKVNIHKYVLIDIPHVIDIQAGVCAKMGITVETVDCSDIQRIQAIAQYTQPRIAFSSYGFAEFEPVTRDWYSQHLLNHCDHGLFIWNYWDRWSHIPPNDVYQFIDKQISMKIDNVPYYSGQDIIDVYW